MKKVVLLRYGEIHLKGKNRGLFENQLIKNILDCLLKIDKNIQIKKIGGRYLLYDFSDENLDLIIINCCKIFGLVSLSVANEIDSSIENIEHCLNLFVKEHKFDLINTKTFKIEVSRADKSFPVHSTDLERQLGGVVLDNLPNLKVNLSNPEKTIYIDIRENKKSYIFMNKIACSGGMPVGTSGKGLIMLSGGIDSPVAAYLMAKRGMKLFAVHFHSFPYTSELAKEKVINLAKIVSNYTGSFKLFIVSFTKIQEEIHKNCKSSYMITIMRRIMMRICQKICEKYGLQAIITGENLGQVASQTVESMTSSQSVLKNIPVFRPVIAFDKIEIINLSRKIGTYETSILPYEDCCTVFLPKNPLIKPKIENVEKEESLLDINNLIDDALRNVEIIQI